MLASYIRFFLVNKLVAYLLLLLFIAWGLVTAPFDFGLEGLVRDPVAVDAIPDIGENQQIVFTNWTGRSPQDVEDQVTYPLTTALLGVPGVKSVRSNSMFGFSSIYLIFEEDVAFYWSRSRILEKLNALPANTLPEGVQPTLGPDATALGQIYWYTLEGRDAQGKATGGWDLHELRTIQDFYVRFGLSAAAGVAEVASIGGFVKEYQVDVDPEAMKAYGISLEQVMQAIKNSNIDIGAQTIEINLAEYFVRGLGYVENSQDIEASVIQVQDNVPVHIGDIARVNIGPATRRGVLDKSGAEAVGGVVVARYGANPLAVIENVKEKIAELGPGLPTKTLSDGTVSQVQVVPFYDRTELINETIGTLEEALRLEILITVIVVLLMLLNLKSSLMVSGTLPVAVLMCFIAMRYFGVDANIVALSGIAIAIGTMVDMGIVLMESIINRLEEAPPDESLLTSIYAATTEVASAVLTAVATTVISFLPIFTMEAAEGKLFRPLAYTKTFALIASIIVALTIIPAVAHSVFSLKVRRGRVAAVANTLAVLVGLVVAGGQHLLFGAILLTIGATGLLAQWLQHKYQYEKAPPWLGWATNIIYAFIVTWLLATVWMPLGVARSSFTNFIFVSLLGGGLIGFFYLVIAFYANILRFLLRFKLLFLLLVGLVVYQGFRVYERTGEEFMPALDEGSFLLMPTAMPHAGMQENIKNLRLLDMAVTAIPEVESVVGKAGRASTPLDPAPMSMYENVILYKSEYRTDESGHRVRFRYEDGEYVRDATGQLIPDQNGRYFRQWRDHIQSPDDIWKEIVRVTRIPGVTSAPKLQPIETRLVMLQTGMRAPMGIKVRGSNLTTIEAFGLELEKHLKEVEGVKEAAVFADRIVGKPYLLLDIDRQAIARYGLTMEKVQQHLQAAVGGMTMTTTVEGRERYAIRIRYPRELRADPEMLKRIYVTTPKQQHIPLGDLVELRYEAGAQSIKSEDGFLIGYVLFDREGDYSEVEVVEQAQAHLTKLIADGVLQVPTGISYRFAGNYEQQVRASKRLAIVLPIALALIFLILYFQFRSVWISLMVFTGVFIAFAGGFIMIGLYDTAWFLNFELFGTPMRELFQIRAVNLSVAVWVGFLALFGIATDDGVLVATFLRDSFKRNQPESINEIREAVVEGGLRRVRPAMMTTATTILALLPVLTSTGRGADIMLPMAIPSFGGMTLQVLTMFTVPILYALWQEWRLRLARQLRGGSWWSRILGVGALLLLGTTLVQGQDLDQLRREIRSANPGLKMLRTEYEAALARIPQVGQLPEPELGLGIFPLPVETRLGGQQARLSATQQFPWFGTLSQREAVASAQAELVVGRVDVRAIELIYQGEQAYFQLYELRSSQDILRESLRLLRTFEELALAKVQSGQASAADVLRVQLKIAELEQELAIRQKAEAGPLATLNQVRNQAAETPFVISEKLTPAKLPYRKDSLLTYVEAKHPVLRLLDRQRRVATEALALNELQAKPSFGLGLDFIAVDKRTDIIPQNNGRDILQVRASVKVPLFREQYAAREREETLRMQALDYESEAILNQIGAQLVQAYADYETAKLELELYETQVELTEATLRILLADYRSGGEKFEEVLRLEQDLITYKFKALRAVVKTHLAQSSIQRFLTP